MIDIFQYKSVCIELKDEQLAIETSNHVLVLMSEVLDELKAERDKNEAHLNVLRDTLARLKEEGNMKALVSDIEQYFVDIGVIDESSEFTEKQVEWLINRNKGE